MALISRSIPASAEGEAARLDLGSYRYLVQMAALTAGGLIAAYGAAFAYGNRMPNLAQEYAGYCLLALALVGALAVMSYTILLLFRGEREPLRKVSDYSARLLTPAVLARRALPIVLTFTFLGAFTVLKIMIPRINPFSWDAAFSDLDRLIFGTDPWRITHALIGPAGTRLIDAVYVTWLPVFACAVFYHSVFAPPERQRRFFLSFYGVWIILGLVAATLMSSAGPCFLELIHHDYAVRYAPLFPLENANGSQAAMKYLAEGYLSGGIAAAKGISAMPSVHVAIAFLYVLVSRRPAMIALCTAYFLVILLGSVHLGWHYAVDGIVAVLATWLIWRATALPKSSAPAPEKTVATALTAAE